LEANVERLKLYLEKLIVLPKKNGRGRKEKKSKGEVSLDGMKWIGF
jgi:hypothetical protein